MMQIQKTKIISFLVQHFSKIHDEYVYIYNNQFSNQQINDELIVNFQYKTYQLINIFMLLRYCASGCLTKMIHQFNLYTEDLTILLDILEDIIVHGKMAYNKCKNYAQKSMLFWLLQNSNLLFTTQLLESDMNIYTQDVLSSIQNIRVASKIVLIKQGIKQHSHEQEHSQKKYLHKGFTVVCNKQQYDHIKQQQYDNMYLYSHSLNNIVNYNQTSLPYFLSLRQQGIYNVALVNVYKSSQIYTNLIPNGQVEAFCILNQVFYDQQITLFGNNLTTLILMNCAYVEIDQCMNLTKVSLTNVRNIKTQFLYHFSNVSMFEIQNCTLQSDENGILCTNFNDFSDLYNGIKVLKCLHLWEKLIHIRVSQMNMPCIVNLTNIKSKYLKLIDLNENIGVQEIIIDLLELYQLQIVLFNGKMQLLNCSSKNHQFMQRQSDIINFVTMNKHCYQEQQYFQEIKPKQCYIIKENARTFLQIQKIDLKYLCINQLYVQLEYFEQQLTQYQTYILLAALNHILSYTNDELIEYIDLRQYSISVVKQFIQFIVQNKQQIFSFINNSYNYITMILCILLGSSGHTFINYINISDQQSCQRSINQIFNVQSCGLFHPNTIFSYENTYIKQLQSDQSKDSYACDPNYIYNKNDMKIQYNVFCTLKTRFEHNQIVFPKNIKNAIIEFDNIIYTNDVDIMFQDTQSLESLCLKNLKFCHLNFLNTIKNLTLISVTFPVQTLNQLKYTENVSIINSIIQESLTPKTKKNRGDSLWTEIINQILVNNRQLRRLNMVISQLNEDLIVFVENIPQSLIFLQIYATVCHMNTSNWNMCENRVVQNFTKLQSEINTRNIYLIKSKFIYYQKMHSKISYNQNTITNDLYHLKNCKIEMNQNQKLDNAELQPQDRGNRTLLSKIHNLNLKYRNIHKYTQQIIEQHKYQYQQSLQCNENDSYLNAELEDSLKTIKNQELKACIQILRKYHQNNHSKQQPERLIRKVKSKISQYQIQKQQQYQICTTELKKRLLHNTWQIQYNKLSNEIWDILPQNLQCLLLSVDGSSALTEAPML